jgi:hypothetical protein
MSSPAFALIESLERALIPKNEPPRRPMKGAAKVHVVGLSFIRMKTKE